MTETCDPSRMAAGGPGFPGQFRWGRRIVQVTTLLRAWKDTGPCHHGSGERYVRKHWFEFVADTGEILTVYFLRQPPRGAKPGRGRWWLHTSRPKTSPPAGPAPNPPGDDAADLALSAAPRRPENPAVS